MVCIYIFGTVFMRLWPNWDGVVDTFAYENRLYRYPK